MQHAIPTRPSDARHTAMTAAVSACVHCGFCLPACPTYRVLGEEMDAPRGRIVLMKEVLEGTLPLADAAPHLDRCLGCLACETACPSGVRYRDLIEPMRTQLDQARPVAARTWRHWLLHVMTSPARFRLAAALGAGMAQARGLLPPSMGAMLGLLPARLPAAQTFGGVTPARGPRRGRVALMTGCVQHVLRPSITEAAIRVLAAGGIGRRCRQVGCCGALATHAVSTIWEHAQARAHEARFPTDVDAVVATAAGCGSSMKATHTHGAPVRDLLEYLDAVGLVAPLALATPAVAAYQDACHLGHAQGGTSAPRRLLARVRGLTLVAIADAGLCCGSAGLYNIEQPDLARDLGRRKAEAIVASGATMTLTANIGCLTQIETSLAVDEPALPVHHVAELLSMALPPTGARE
ncbi:MAG: heterodisulfide reductase-related iron-sulfur binding cluster [Vicinamibacterales bacterium]